MEFISAEEFLKQPKEVQEVFLEWWEPSIGDLFSWIKNNYEYENDLRKLECCNSDNIVEMTKIFKGINEGDRIPLLSEGQLRKFIEDKTNCHIEIIVGISGYVFVLRSKETLKEEKRISVLKRDLLQAYWKVAIQIAEQL